MKGCYGAIGLVFMVVLALSFPAAAVEQGREGEPEAGTGDRTAEAAPAQKGEGSREDGKQSAYPVVYKPPMRGAPGGRIGGGTRGIVGTFPKVVALVPDHVGMTGRSRPTLLWYLSEPMTGRIELTLNDEQKGVTLVRVDLPAPQQSGVQEVNLADYNVSLSPGVVYQWFVTAIVDPGQPSRDLFSGGGILYEEPSKPVPEESAKAGSMDMVSAYAEEGFWYDALAVLYRMVKADPRDEQARATLGSLLKQQGLEIAWETH